LNKNVLRHVTLWHLVNIQGEGIEVLKDHWLYEFDLDGSAGETDTNCVAISQCSKGYFLSCTEHDHHDC